MSDRARNILDTARRMRFFGEANPDLATLLPLSAVEFTTLDSLIGQLEAAGVSRFSASSAGKDETRSKGAIYDELYEKARSIAGTAIIVKKKFPDFVNRFELQRDRLSYSELIQRTKAMYADSEADKKKFTDLGLPENFREDLKTDYTALEEGTQRQADAKRESVGDTAEIEAVCEQILDVRETLNRMMKNLFKKTNPQKYAEWKTAAHIRRRGETGDGTENKSKTPDATEEEDK